MLLLLFSLRLESRGEKAVPVALPPCLPPPPTPPPSHSPSPRAHRRVLNNRKWRGRKFESCLPTACGRIARLTLHRTGSATVTAPAEALAAAVRHFQEDVECV